MEIGLAAALRALDDPRGERVSDALLMHSALPDAPMQRPRGGRRPHRVRKSAPISIATMKVAKVYAMIVWPVTTLRARVVKTSTSDDEKVVASCGDGYRKSVKTGTRLAPGN